MRKFILFLYILVIPFIVNAQENKETEKTNPIQEELENTTQNREKQSAQISTDFDNQYLEEQMSTIDLPTLEKLKQDGFDFNQTDKYGNPPLYYVLARNPNLEIAKKIIEYGADVNQPAKNGIIPLNIATSRANELQLQIMMMKTLKPEVQQAENLEVLKQYVYTEMTKAIEMTQLLIDSGADINLVSSLGTPLMNAVTNVWNLDIAKMLVKAGANLNATDTSGRTALFYAYASSNDEAVNLLIENGADTTIKDVDGKIYSQMEKVNVEPAI